LAGERSGHNTHTSRYNADMEVLSDLPTQTMLQHYLREIMRRARFTEVLPGVTRASISELGALYADGENERNAEQNLAATVAAWLAYHLIHGLPLPVIGDIDLESERGRRLLAIEHGIAYEVSDQAWFWDAEWQAGEAEASADIAAGRVERFDSAEDFLASFPE
jgi:hypothetical protein